MELNIKIYWGISIILKYQRIFEYLIENNIYNKIICNIDYKSFKSLRNNYGNHFFMQYYNFAKYINSNTNILYIKEDYNYSLIGVDDLISKYNVNFDNIYRIYKNIIHSNHFNLKYITISTKILSIDENIYQSKKSELFLCINNFIKNNKYKLVILGEQTVETCIEYNIHNAFSIYNDCIEFIDQTHIIDNTYKSSIMTNDSIDSFIKSMEILHYSNLNIFIGNGGVSEIIHFSSDKILGLTTKYTLLDNVKNKPTIQLFNNFDTFLTYFKNMNNKAILKNNN